MSLNSYLPRRKGLFISEFKNFQPRGKLFSLYPWEKFPSRIHIGKKGGLGKE